MSWDTEKLGKLLTPSGRDRAGANDYPVLSITMHEGLVDQSAKFKKRVASSDISNYRVVYADELVVGFPIDEGVLGFQTRYPAAVVSPAYGIWRLTNQAGTHIPFIQSYLRSSEARGIYASKMRGAVARRRSLTRQEFLNIEIPFPPLEEQKRIAAMLDKVDALRRQRRESLQFIDKLLKSLFIDMFGEPETNPLGLPKCTIGDLLASAQYGTSAKAFAAGTWPVLRMGNITYEGGWSFSSLKYMELTPEEEQRYLVQNGDILFNRTNSKELVGKTAVFREASPMAFAGYLIRCRVNDEADPEYVAAFLNSSYGKTILRSTCKSIVGMANINATELRGIAILKPPVTLQKQFGEAVRSILRLRAAVTEAATSDDSLFGAIQQRAFRGELDLSRLILEEVSDVTEPAADAAGRLVPLQRPEAAASKRAKRAFVASPEVEQALVAQDARAEQGNPIDWSEDYFRYRILGDVLRAPCSFVTIWEEVERRMPDANYHEVKDKIFEYISNGTLRQRFDKKQKSLVLFPRRA
jgi:type I restriction enzyme, S subunit